MMQILNGFLIAVISFQVVTCKTYIRPVIKKKPVQFQWQFQSLGDDDDLSSLKFSSGGGSSASASASASSGGKRIKVTQVSDNGSQKQSQSTSIDKGGVRISSSSTKQPTNQKNGVIKIKISNPYVPQKPVKVVQTAAPPVRKPAVLQPMFYPFIHYVYALPNIKFTQNEETKKDALKFYPIVSASASASSSSSSSDGAHTQVVSVDTDVIPDTTDTVDDDDDDEDTQVQVQAPIYVTFKPKGKMNVDDDDVKMCQDEGEGQSLIKTQVFCESDIAELSCENNKTLHILQANFERISHDICPEEVPYLSGLNQNCSKSVLEEVKKICAGQKTCNLKVQTFQDGSPCNGRSRYLQLMYKCEC